MARRDVIRPGQLGSQGAATLGTIGLLVGGVLGCERGPTAPAAAPPDRVRGITFVDWSAGGYGTGTAESALHALAETGANTVTMIVTAYQANAMAAAIRADDPRTPTAAAVTQAIQWAKAMGLRVELKPHVDVDDGAWRGRIAPAAPREWFAAYREFILPWASLATDMGAAQFVVGTELAGTLSHTAEWSETIRRVREVFPGTLSYAASWDEAARVPFWRQLDLVGIDFYCPVAQRTDPGRLEILAGWQPWLERLHLLHRQTGRPVLLSEIGYCSTDGAGMHPYRYQVAVRLDLEEQADLYWAALSATAQVDWIAGVCWWNWPANGAGGADDAQYTPRGKPAAAELAAAWRR